MSVLPTAAAVTAMLAAAAWGDPQRVASWADSPIAMPSGQIVFEAEGAFEAARWTGDDVQPACANFSACRRRSLTPTSASTPAAGR